MTLRPRIIALAAATLLAAASAGCGSDDGEGSGGGRAATAPAASAFPQPAGQGLGELVAGIPEGPILAPSVQVLEPGEDNRFAFALFDSAKRQITGARVAVYVSRTDGSGVAGPFPARAESLETEGRFQAQTTAADPDSARSVYVADVPFPKRGEFAVLGLAELDGRMLSTGARSVIVGGKKAERPPAVGERAVKVSTPTVTDVGGDLEKIDTRVPPLRHLHEEDLADVLGKKPVVLLFATPQLCQSRVCGPVVDVLAQLEEGHRGKAAFIHQEIFNDNQIAKGYRPQVGAWRLPSEPWLFAIKSDGRVAARLEGAFSVREAEQALQKALKS